METTQLKDVIPLFERLTGEQVKISLKEKANTVIFKRNSGLGYTQFNEILLLLGFNRVPDYLFQFIVNGDMEYEQGASIGSVQKLEEGVNRFVEFALLFFGNIKFALKTLSDFDDEFEIKYYQYLPFRLKYYTTRHNPIIDIEPISPNKTYLLGYLVADKYRAILKEFPNNKEATAILEERKSIIEIGKRNQTAYLSFDHMDVYVATSMRHEHEYIFVNQLVGKIFKNRFLNKLKLRWFDPTQAFCDDRIDKGLSEALMLKRAKCTLYLAQESDTLGKDSELASTLAQGKPVIAYVPIGDEIYGNELLESLKRIHPEKDEKTIIIEQLKLFNPHLAWEDKRVMNWIASESNVELTSLKNKFYNVVRKHYNDRADTLKKKHPLGIQVNLKSGVANGVLVVRNIDDCAKLIRSVILNNMSFEIATEKKRGGEYIYLKEKITGSIFRVKTGDTMLTNTFWNFYLVSSEN